MKKNRLNIYYVLISCAFAGCMLSCSTQKNTFFYRSYHDITTRYNIYYNGNESYKEAAEVIDYAAKDNYTSILPVFIAPDKTEALKSAPLLDRTIEKCSKAIKKHSMYIRGVEYCRSIPDAYLLMGKAYFKRQDYGDAMSIFSYIANTHSNSKVWVEGQTWRARTFIAMNRLPEAEETLETARLPVSNCKRDRYKMHWEANFADYYLKIKDYEQASLYLSEVLKHKRLKKDFRTRIRFILGQVYQQLDQNADAVEQYEYVIKKTPPYEMEFNAAINLALCSSEKSKQGRNAYDKLRKMLKDERNATYRDQLFYAMAMLDLRDDKTEEAIKNLEASVFWNINNPHQKTLSALTLAELFFNNNQYVDAQLYYDTVVNIIPPTYPNYVGIKERASILKHLVQNLVVIHTEDSLQRIANMSETEREKYIASLIEQYKIREAKRIADEDARNSLMEDAKKQNNTRARSSESTWLFYNPTLVKMGIQEFRKRWGERKLEDFWSVKDIKMNSFIVNDTEENETADSDETVAAAGKKPSLPQTSDPENPAYYLQNVPFTQKQRDISNEAIANALYNAGMIYFDDLHETPNSIKLLEELVKRYPDHKLYPLACFQLYKEYLAVNNTDRSNYYKEVILEKYPNSDYARIINDPDYYKRMEAIRDHANMCYASVYDAYKKADYASVVNLANECLTKYRTPELSPKFEFLRAIALSKLFGNDTLSPLLKDISRNYPTTEIDTFATEMLETLKRLETAASAQKDAETKQSGSAMQNTPVYTYDDKAFHFVIVIANVKDVNIEPLKNKISTFNRDYFRLERFEINSFYIDDFNQMITVSKFQDKEKAMNYYNLMKADTRYLSDINTVPSTKTYVISDANHTTFFQNPDKRAEYEDFFKKYYLK